MVGKVRHGTGPGTSREEICVLLRQFFARQEDVAAAYLVGSRARGDERADSDVDVGVFFRGTVARDAVQSLERRSAIAADLEGILPARADVVDLDRVSPWIFHAMFEDALLVFLADRQRQVLAVLRQDQLYQDEFDLYVERMAYVRRQLL